MAKIPAKNQPSRKRVNHENESEFDRTCGVRRAWTPERLREILHGELRGHKVIVVANREPYIHNYRADGTIKVVHPASGLVSALEPVLRACSGTWIAHGAGSADRETADEHARIAVPPNKPCYSLRRVWLTDAEEEGYYYGLANQGLWPLCHVAHTRPVFREAHWECYKQVNQKFADAVVQEADCEDPIVLVQDYHLALAPQMIRQQLPKAAILTFWHIPWPNAEQFGIFPWAQELINGLLGSSIVGFHTQQHCNHFVDCVDAYIESRIDREHYAVVQGQEQTMIRPYPISIDWPVPVIDELPSPSVCRETVVEEFGLSDDALIGVGVDRLDYTKGIEERLIAVGEALVRDPSLRGRLTFFQLSAPSRSKIPAYAALEQRVITLVEEINEKWGEGTYRPIVLLQEHHDAPAVFRFYRAGDFCYVSSLHDGMNLVAKEFVAAREDARGVLILSQFTGASRELTEALMVNPYDITQVGHTIAQACSMPLEEQRERMLAMRETVEERNIYRWAGRMLMDTAELRRREQLHERLSSASLTPMRSRA